MNPLVERNLKQEELFVLLCCRNVRTGESLHAINDLATKNLDWDVILNIASLHGIAGLLHVTLAQCSNRGYVPDNLLKKLEMAYRHNAFRNLLYAKEFNEIANQFNRANIRTIPLKGIEFLHSIYTHDIGLRSLSDIDILVEKADVPRAEKILLGMGYKTNKTGYRYSLLHFHLIFWRSSKKPPIIIELHWDVDFPDSPFNIDITECWERSQEISNGKIHYYEFSVEDSIIFNSFHIFRATTQKPDSVLSLKYFCDIANIIAQSGDRINWECIIARSQKYHVLRPVALVLLLVQDLLEVKTIPPVIAEALRTSGYRDDFGLRAVKEYIFFPVDSKKNQLPSLAIDFTSQTTVWKKIKVILNVPAAMLQLYKRLYYADLDPSVGKTVKSTIWYSINEFIKTMVLYMWTPVKTRTLKKNLILKYQKNQEVINWIRG
jgi:Uncharacterised nucleotidyltransferase